MNAIFYQMTGYLSLLMIKSISHTHIPIYIYIYNRENVIKPVTAQQPMVASIAETVLQFYWLHEIHL